MSFAKHAPAGAHRRKRTLVTTQRRAALPPLTPALVNAMVAIFLLVIVWFAFGPALTHGFIDYDDHRYVDQNPTVTNGLTLDGIRWAFTHVHASNWHPLTTISHMLDCQLYGLQPWGHHLTNVLLHAAATVFLFLALWELTGAQWPSAFVAAVFAIHPLRVESVAWIAERKDVLSGVFFMLTLLAYFRWTRKQTVGRYLAMSILFGCGLMQNPMLITTPIILLLLDYWPLNRSQKSEVRSQKSSNPPWTKLVVEKVPLFVLSIGSCFATLWAQNFALGSTQFLPLQWRVTNALFSYFEYVRQMFWPVDLIPFYVHLENRLEIWRLLIAAISLIALTAI